MKPSLAMFALVLLSQAAAAQHDPLPAQSQPAEPAHDRWEVSGNVFYSNPPGSDGRTTLIGYADNGPLHLELRYGYEDADTMSLFAGWNVENEKDAEVQARITPMLGVVGGDTDGIAPGLEFDIGWKRLSWYTEAEYLFDDHDSNDDFFYSWSTLMYSLTDSLRAGIVAERTKQVDTDFEVQRGLALEYAGKHVGCSVYAYNLDDSHDSYVVASLSFAP